MDYKTGIVEIEIDEDETITIDIDNMMRVDTQNLTEEFAKQASLMAYMSTLAARAEAEWGYAEQDLTETQAKISKDVRMDMLADGGKVTEARITAEVNISKGYLMAVEEKIYRKMQYRILRGWVDALNQRGSMLQSIGAQLRAELEQTNMTINAVKAKKESGGKERKLTGERVPPF